MIRKTILLTYLIIFWSFCPGQARDPNVAEPDYYGELAIVHGSEGWTFADTWTLCGIATMALLLYALPRTFDGSYQKDPGFLGESRQGYYPLGYVSLSSSDFRGNRLPAGYLTIGAPIVSREFPAQGPIINSMADRFKFPTRGLQKSVIR